VSLRELAAGSGRERRERRYRRPGHDTHAYQTGGEATALILTGSQLQGGRQTSSVMNIRRLTAKIAAVEHL
jgi:hypothetical protein